ncbi:MAG: protein jag [Oscillospiraceae bacterium]|nr:protein jag [Oscillospiraceae bacterium]
MLKWIESTGRTEDAAIEAALVKLGLDRDEVSVELLERAKTGFLGIGSCPAKVKVTYEVPDEPELVVPPQSAQTAQGTETKREPELPKQVKAPAVPEPQVEIVKEAVVPPAAPVLEDGYTERITAFLTGLLAHMGVEASPKIARDEQGSYQVELVGRNLGSLIGRRGETLDAIQQLTGYAVNRGQSKRVRIHVDAEGYRAKREESLERLAHKVAGKVVKYRRNVTLEPMNAYERHVIHTALQDYPNVTTYSVGTEPNRRTVVAYSRGEHQKSE